MTFYVEFDEDTEKEKEGLPFDIEDLFFRSACESLDYTGCPYECEADLTLTGDEGIRDLNNRFRGRSVPTDVLSFPLLSFKTPGDFETVEEDFADCFNPETGELMLGSLVINLDRARKQAEEFGHSLKRETAFLIVHSMLHLQGFDHIEEEDRVIMEEAQRVILKKLDISREASFEE